MKLLENQSKLLLSTLGIPVTQPVVAESLDAVRFAAAAIGEPVVIKALVPFGGRGKLGGVRFAEGVENAVSVASDIFNKPLRGFRVDKVLVDRRINFVREIYVGVTWDLLAKLPRVIISTAGGVNVEMMPERANSMTFESSTGLSGFHARELAKQAGFLGQNMLSVGAILKNLSDAFIQFDAVTLELNPLVELPNGSLLALDARIEIDSDAIYRQADRLKSVGIQPSLDSVFGRPASTLELEAQRIDAMDHRGVAGRVVEFEGSLALLIGGGGASLTVFDAIRRYGGRPANYCEIGGNPTEEKVASLTHLLMKKPGVRKLAVIMNVVNNTRADVIARGVLEGLRRANIEPSDAICVFRIPGSWEQEATSILATAGIRAEGREVSLDHAAYLAVKGAQDVA